MREGNACLGCIIGAPIALLIHAFAALLLYLAWNGLAHAAPLSHMTYWQALVIVLELGCDTAGLLLLWVIRQEKRL